MEAIEYLKLATDKTEAGDLIKENNLTDAIVKLMSNYAEFRVKNCYIPDVCQRSELLAFKRFISKTPQVELEYYSDEEFTDLYLKVNCG